MSRPEIHLVAGTRPNFMKVAPVYHLLQAETWCRPVLVHTGQHYDEDMSGAFLRDLGLPRPDHALEVGSGSHAEQTGGVMVAYEALCLARPPAWVVVVGDVNSTLACALVAAKLCLPLAHLEAGLRSGDRAMPEEINRLLTDRLADLLWTPSPDADRNLRAGGIAEGRIERVGNIMIDAYELLRPKITVARTRERFGLSPGGYGVVTLHRPVNVDDRAALEVLVRALTASADRLPLVFPVHPRTRQRLETFGLAEELGSAAGLHVTGPLGYIEFMSLVAESALVITDSGGVQEETTYLGLPCLTLRETTERPITLSLGTNRLVRPGDLEAAVAEALSGAWPRGKRPDLWDGRTAQRVADSLRRRLSQSRDTA